MQSSFTSEFRLLHRLVFILATVAALLPLATTHADVGPKPTADFEFEYQIDPVDIVAGELIQCKDETCEAGDPLEELGPQHFECTAANCSSMAYGYATYMKLVITFTDRVRESNVFTKAARDATFKVIVLESSLEVEEVRKGPLSGGCCSALAATIALELLVATIYVSAFHLSRTILGWVPLGSVLTIPVVWFVFPLLPLPAGLVVGLAEVFVVAFETGFIYLASWRTTSLKHVAALSLLMNGASFLVGLLLRL
jgi:hypothetical protein